MNQTFIQYLKKLKREEMMSSDNQRYKTAIYCRLSKDDEQSTGESVSIETQKMILEHFCHTNGFTISNVYVDDGFSGLNFNRPGFIDMIKDIEDGKKNLVITKHLSRLGRDYIQTGYYTDIYFAQKEVRYIAVNDGIDTISDNNDIAPFKNILNDMYAKDLSRKVKTARRQRAQKGYYLNAMTPYGYKVDPENHNHLVVDDCVAEVVKEIFSLFLSGNNYSEITRILSRNKIISPCVYKTKNGDTTFIRFVNPSSMYNWTDSTIKWILTNQMYVGDMVNLKGETINYKTKKRISLPKEKQIIIPNMHEPIIAREIFEEVQEKIKKYQRNSAHKQEDMFKNILFCGECGTSMSFQNIRKNKNGKSEMGYVCRKHISNPKECTYNHNIYYKDLYDLILNQLNKILNEKKNESADHIRELVYRYLREELAEERKKLVSEEISNQKKQLKLLHRDFTNGKIDFDYYTSILNQYTIRQKELTRALTGDSDDFSLKRFNLLHSKIDNVLKSDIHLDTLDRAILQRFIKRIEIGHKYFKNDEFTHDVIITYNFCR